MRINVQALVLHYVKEFLYTIIVIIANETILEFRGLHVTQRPQSSDLRVRTAASVKENDYYINIHKGALELGFSLIIY